MAPFYPPIWGLLRRFFAPDQFEVAAQWDGKLAAVVTHVTGTIGPNDRTAPYVDTNRLLGPIEGHVVTWLEDDATIVIEGQFEGSICSVTIISPIVVHARSEKSDT